ncbi:hypothetical protein PPACK8108_LOCUS16787 [Phakopsora pachyrhizi]|uniref:Uncharacterized protein n=1 Tax=Phakopsora pachyrhizi TaxID=170000 RepID=A0AAV0B8N6_PHAPC|nr:hypothetical protein PPACK8108_LOCUS16787 [Phakopsora pachyrhizi]
MTTINKHVTENAEGSGSSIHNIEAYQHPHGYPRLYADYQNPYYIYHLRSKPQSSYMHDHSRINNDPRKFLVPENEYQVPKTSIPPGSVTEQIWGLPGIPIHRWSYQLPFINHFETIHTGPLVSLISHGGLSVGLSLRESL